MTFNRNEQIALLLLCAALLVGTAVSLLDRYVTDLPDFEVRKNAVPIPADPAPEPESPPAAPEAGQPAAQPEAGATLIDINRAPVSELQNLPTIGPVTARRIVEYRQQHGPFGRLEDLQAVKGIGPKTIERLRNLATP